MPLIKDGRFVEDRFVAIQDGDLLPASANPIVPLERFLKDRDALLKRNTPFGVRLKSNENPEQLRGDIERISVVALEFPNFRDGRAFSKARALRTRLAYKGEVRAVGQFLYDQLALMMRTGFDAIEVPDGFRQDDFARAMKELSYFYQPSVDGKKTIRELRATR